MALIKTSSHQVSINHYYLGNYLSSEFDIVHIDCFLHGVVREQLGVIEDGRYVPVAELQKLKRQFDP